MPMTKTIITDEPELRVTEERSAFPNVREHYLSVGVWGALTSLVQFPVCALRHHPLGPKAPAIRFQPGVGDSPDPRISAQTCKCNAVLRLYQTG